MTPRSPLTLALSLALAAALAGCATSSGQSSAARGGAGPQVRCLGDTAPGSPATTTRPLFFLFCLQSP